MALGKRLINTGVAEAACLTDDVNPFTGEVADGGVALYSLDYDASDAGGLYDGTPTNVDFGVGGKTNYGARFNGSSSKITVSTSATTPVDFTSENFSISLWFKADSLHSGALIGKWSTSDGTGRAILLHTNSNGTFTFSERQGTSGFNLTTTSTYAADTWNHFVYVRNATQSILYLNKVSETDSRTNSINNGSNTELAIGYQTGGFKYFDGSIDQVRIFSKALNQTEVDTLYAETACVYTSTTDDVNYPFADGTNVEAYYKLDNSSEDFSTGGNDGTDTDIEYRFGRFGQAAVFNGSSSTIDTGYTPPTGSNNFSISCWLNWTGASTDGVWSTFTNEQTNRLGIGLAVHSSGRVDCNVFDSAGVAAISSNDPNVISTNQWYNVVITYDGGLTKMYIDGTLQTSTVNQVITAHYASLHLGNYYASLDNANMWEGSIDQVRIYSTALTSSQVTKLYNEKPEVDTSNFKAVLWDGTTAENYISQVGMDLETSGGLVWIKQRSLIATHHRLFDSVRGVTQILASSNSNAQGSNSETLKSFEANGFVLGTNTAVNETGDNFVAWVWKGGGDDVLNEEGSIDSQVSANTEAGFSIVKFTVPASGDFSAGHGLSSTPEMVITKSTDSFSWFIFHKDLSSGSNGIYTIQFNTNEQNGSYKWWGDGMTSDVIGGTANTSFDINTETVAYCFHSVAGYSKIGSYEGNTTTLPSITLGFKPSFVMVKNVDGGDNWHRWYMFDDKRQSTNSRNLAANLNSAEPVNNDAKINFEANGFSIANSSNYLAINDNGDTYLYMAFK